MASVLAARSASNLYIRDDKPLSDDAIRAVCPSIYAEAPHESRSDRYQYIATVTVLDALRKAGFQPFAAMQAKCQTRTAHRLAFTRHMLRLRHPDSIKNKDAAHEIILLNSHDGTSSFQLLSGLFRFACLNGMVCGDVDNDYRIRHKGPEIEREVIEGSFRVLSDTRRNNDIIEDMMSREMSSPRRIAFANKAIELRWGAGNKVVTPTQILEARRDEDKGNDEWSIFNRVQENIIEGGFDGKSANGKTRSVRALDGMDRNLNVNRNLWELMQASRAKVAA